MITDMVTDMVTNKDLLLRHCHQFFSKKGYKLCGIMRIAAKTEEWDCYARLGTRSGLFNDKG